MIRLGGRISAFVAMRNLSSYSRHGKLWQKTEDGSIAGCTTVKQRTLPGAFTRLVSWSKSCSNLWRVEPYSIMSHDSCSIDLRHGESNLAVPTICHYVNLKPKSD